jgi:hypothetical protein
VSMSTSNSDLKRWAITSPWCIYSVVEVLVLSATC